MEFRNDSKIFDWTPASKVFFYLVCILSFCVHVGHGKPLSQEHTPIQDQSVSSNKPMIYVEIPSWENRTGYPRFLIYRDHFRRHLDGDSKNEDSQVAPYAKPDTFIEKNENNTSSSVMIRPPPLRNVDDKEKYSLKAKTVLISTSSGETSTSTETDYENGFSSSLEKLLVERGRKTHGAALPQSTVSSTNQGSNGSPSEPNANSFMSLTPAVQDKQVVINFPKDKTNPCNRLQINPDDEKVEEVESENKSSSSSSSKESFEIGNRESFPSRIKHKVEVPAEEDVLHVVKNAVPTVELTMKIIEQSRWGDENVIFSPLSIANVLSMLLLGAGGETFKELSTQLDKHANIITSPHTLWNIHRYHEAFKKLLVYLRTNSGPGVMLNSASEVFVDKSFPVNHTFQKELLSYYEAPLESFDFEQNGHVFVQKINKWVREKTHNQIQSILKEPPLASTTMGIINAIHFKGAWEVPFSDKVTRLRDFRVQPKEKVKAQMMINIMTIPYIERETYSMTAVPYKENQTALFLILPKGSDGINDLRNVEMSLTRKNLNESITLMKDTKLALTLPRLKFSSDGEMKMILENMGLSTLFNDRANFSGMSSEKGLYISQILHRAAVEINEKGTEASAVTIGTADRIIDDPPIPFGCNKPFIFFIYHVKADTILFWGRVIRPYSRQFT